jgi:hypothetical protein
MIDALKGLHKKKMGFGKNRNYLKTGSPGPAASGINPAAGGKNHHQRNEADREWSVKHGKKTDKGNMCVVRQGVCQGWNDQTSAELSTENPQKRGRVGKETALFSDSGRRPVFDRLLVAPEGSGQHKSKDG